MTPVYITLHYRQPKCYIISMKINFNDEKNKQAVAYKRYNGVRTLIKEFLSDKRFYLKENEKYILNIFMLYTHERIILNRPPFQTLDGVINLDVYREFFCHK